MPHPESEHGLRVQLATALRQLEEEKAMAGRLGDRAWAAEEERDDLRAEVKRLRELLEKHGSHTPECAGTPTEDESRCDCGLTAALVSGGDHG